MDMVCVVVFMVNLVVILVDRYLKIIKLFSYYRYMMKKCLFLVIGGVWLYVFILVLFVIIKWFGVYGVIIDVLYDFCYNDNKVFYIVVNIVVFFFLFIVLIVSYSLIFCIVLSYFNKMKDMIVGLSSKEDRCK